MVIFYVPRWIKVMPFQIWTIAAWYGASISLLDAELSDYVF